MSQQDQTPGQKQHDTATTTSSESDSDEVLSQQQPGEHHHNNTTTDDDTVAKPQPTLRKEPSSISTIRGDTSTTTAPSSATLTTKKPTSTNMGNMTVETETVSAVPTVAVSNTNINPDTTSSSGNNNANTTNSSTTNNSISGGNSMYNNSSVSGGQTNAATATASSSSFTTANNNNTNNNNASSQGNPSSLGANNNNNTNSVRGKKSTDNVTNKGLTRSKKKKNNRLVPTAGNSKAEIFAAKIASAVDEVDSSDSDETFVYESNSHNESNAANSNNNNTSNSNSRPRFHRNLSSSSIQPETIKKSSNPTVTTAAAGESVAPATASYVTTANSTNNNNRNSWSSPRRNNNNVPQSPSLRPAASRYFDNKHQQNLYRWRSGSYADDFDEDDDDIGRGDDDNIEGYDEDDEYLLDNSEITPLRQKNNSSYRSIRRSKNNPGMVVYSPHNYRRKPPSARYYYFRLVLWMVFIILCILGIGFILGFLLATSKPLDSLQVEEIFDIIISDQELAFDMSIQAINPGYLAVDIYNTDLDIFAKSSHLNNGDDDDEPPSDPWTSSVTSAHTLLLGNVKHFNAPVTFEGGFFNKVVQSSVGDVKLMNPGKNVTGDDKGGNNGGGSNTTTALFMSNNSNGDDDDDDLDSGQKKWVRLSSYPFELIVRGILKYNLMLGRGQRTVSIVQTVHVDPTTENGVILSR